MQIISIIFLSLFIISCGEVPEEVGPGNIDFNEPITYEEDDYLSQTEKTLLINVCDALASKDQFFERVYVNRGRTLQFKLVTSDCEGSIINDSIFSSEVTATSRGIELVTVKSGGFKDILTPSSDLIQPFCNVTPSTENVHRAQRYRQSATWLSFLKGGQGGCGGNEDEACLIYKSGTKEGNGSRYRLNDVELFRVNLNSQSQAYGVVLSHALASSRYCADKSKTRVSEQRALSF